MKKNCRSTALEDISNVILSNLSLTLHNNLVTLDRYYFTSILINEVFIPALQYTSSKTLTDGILKVLLVNLNFLCQVENAKNVLIALKADSTEKSCNRQLLLTIDIGIHHIVDVGCKLNPRTLERNDTCTVENSTVSMNTLAKEHTRRSMQLSHYNTLCTIDYKCTIAGHVRNSTQENILDNSTEILMIRVSTIQLHLSLQWNTICKSSLQALIDAITRRVNIVVKELKHEVITRVCYREIL